MNALFRLLFAVLGALLRVPFKAIRGLKGAGPLPILSLSALAAIVVAGWIGFSSLKDTPKPGLDADAVTASVPDVPPQAADYAASDAQLRALLE